MTFLETHADTLLKLSQHIPNFFWNCMLGGIAIITGLILQRFVGYLIHLLTRKNENHNYFVLILNKLGTPINIFLPLLILNGLQPFMELEPMHAHYLDKAIEVSLYISFAFILIRGVLLFEEYIYLHYDLTKIDNLKERKVRTQLQFIRQFLILMIIILTIAVVLLSFDSLRKLGAGLLTGVGIGGIIIGFAAQKSLGNLLAGFQIAFTQPIRIDDVLIVEGEYGRVEDINLTYVVLKIWDERRLILPITYFIEKPFQNWTRKSSDIMGTVFLHMDYSMPIDELRTYYYSILEKNDLWDKRVKNLQVTDSKERTIEIRVLMSARNASDAFDLRCQIREQLIAYIQLTHPEALPRVRLGENTQISIAGGNFVNSAHESSSS